MLTDKVDACVFVCELNSKEQKTSASHLSLFLSMLYRVDEKKNTSVWLVYGHTMNEAEHNLKPLYIYK